MHLISFFIEQQENLVSVNSQSQALHPLNFLRLLETSVTNLVSLVWPVCVP